MKIALLGDIALFGRFSIINNKDIFKYLEDIKDLLSKYDYVVGNLETPFNNGYKSYGAKSAYICTDEVNVNILKNLNINYVNLANNHIYDYGNDCYIFTKKVLKDNGINYFGIENKQVYIELNGNKISLSGYCCFSTNPLGIKENFINELNYINVAKTIHSNKEKGYNNIISIHAGEEHINYPNYDHINFARKLSNIAPYVYYGHHPHVLQGIEYYNNSLIAYSLGNFCFDDVFTSKSDKPLVKQSINNKSSIILELVYENNALKEHKIIPIFLGDDKIEIGSNEVISNIENYSGKLKLGEKEYNNMRTELLKSIIKNRNSKRDINWVIKRLNFRTIMIMKDLYMNKRNYKLKFKRYL